jgi:O-antigen/teichoic acid export membrane protein
LIFGLAGNLNEMLDRILIKYLLPSNISMEQLGIYGACYKISIFMTIFIQAYRYAAEPFFFAQSSEKNAKVIYAEVMKYFVIVVSFIFLGTMMYLKDVVIFFIGPDFREGAFVIPILLIANLFLGVFYNLSIWYKLTDKTIFGAYLSLFGAVITIILNFYWIPRIGYLGSAWATFICYAVMMIFSYFLGQKYYPVKYDLKNIITYLGLAVLLYLISSGLEPEAKISRILLNTGFLLLFAVVIYYFERRNLKSLIFQKDN